MDCPTCGEIMTWQCDWDLVEEDGFVQTDYLCDACMTNVSVHVPVVNCREED